MRNNYEQYKQEGLSIIDHRGLPYETAEQRFLQFENNRLLTQFQYALANVEPSYSEIEVKHMILKFKQDLQLN